MRTLINTQLGRRDHVKAVCKPGTCGGETGDYGPEQEGDVTYSASRYKPPCMYCCLFVCEVCGKAEGEPGKFCPGKVD